MSRQENREGGQQLVNAPQAAERLEHELPEEHHAAADHTGDGTGAGGALPEQGEEHQRAERGAKAGPRKRQERKDDAVFIQRNDHTEVAKAPGKL